MQTIQLAVIQSTHIKIKNYIRTIFVVEGSLAENVTLSIVFINLIRWNCVWYILL